MNENKTIKINPDLFNFNKNSNKNKTSKNKPIVSSNKLKQKFLNKIKEHKNKEINDFKIKIKNNIQNDSKKENKSTILDNNDDFKNSLDYLTKLSSSNKIIKNNNNNNKINIDFNHQKKSFNYNIDNIVPFGCLKNGIKPCYRSWKTLKNSQYRQPSNKKMWNERDFVSMDFKKSHEARDLNIRINQNDSYNRDFKKSHEARDFLGVKENLTNINLKNNNLNISNLDLDIGDLDSNIYDINTDNLNTDNLNTDNLNTDNLNTDNLNTDNLNTDNLNTDNLNTDNLNTDNLNIGYLDLCNMNNVNNMNNNNLEITTLRKYEKKNEKKNEYNKSKDLIGGNDNKVLNIPIKQTIKKTTIKKYTLGKNKIKKNVGILIKNHQTRKNIMEAHKLLKNKPIVDVKKYLQTHNLIKCGSKCPTDILRKIYESAILSGNVINNNKDLLIHNIQNTQS